MIGSGFIDICGGAGFGWAALELGRFARRRLAGRSTAGEARAGSGAGTPAVLAASALLALVFVFVPNWVGGNTIAIADAPLARLPGDAAQGSGRADRPRRGRTKLKTCGAGHIMSEGFQVPMVAWYFKARISDIEDQPTTNAKGVSEPYGYPWPNVIFQDRDTGSASAAAARPHDPRLGAPGRRLHLPAHEGDLFFEDCSPQSHDKVPDTPERYSI